MTREQEILLKMAKKALSADTSSDLISRANAIEAVGGVVIDEFDVSPTRGYDVAEKALSALPSADADGEDLIIKGAKGIQDGLYNIKDGKLFKYKAKGGTVRTYPIVPSADAKQGEWIDWLGSGNEWECSICKCSIESHGSIAYKYCPMCGARMENTK